MKNTYQKKVIVLSFRLNDLNNTPQKDLQNRLPNQFPFFRKDRQHGGYTPEKRA